jgi:hypothetical protein
MPHGRSGQEEIIRIHERRRPCYEQRPSEFAASHLESAPSTSLTWRKLIVRLICLRYVSCAAAAGLGGWRSRASSVEKDVECWDRVLIEGASTAT